MRLITRNNNVFVSSPIRGSFHENLNAKNLYIWQNTLSKQIAISEKLKFKLRKTLSRL